MEYMCFGVCDYIIVEVLEGVVMVEDFVFGDVVFVSVVEGVVVVDVGGGYCVIFVLMSWVVKFLMLSVFVCL